MKKVYSKGTLFKVCTIQISVFHFQKKKILGPAAGSQVFIFAQQNKYSSHQKLSYSRMECDKLNVFYLALTEKECPSP